MIDRKTTEKMIAEAKNALRNSYAPYSHYNVAAAVLMDSGRIYTGVNVENASYPNGICAERNAIFHAVSEGEHRAVALALIGGRNAAVGEAVTNYCMPCGMCRQTLREFCDPSEMLIISALSESDYIHKTLEELLPESFGPESLACTEKH